MRRLVTSALPYVNNEPHLGNLIQVLSADAFARFCRLSGYETLYICGTDEYGTATETRAAQEGVTCQELCDRYWALHKKIYDWFGIAFDKFGRTSTPLQTEITQDIFKKLDSQGLISEHEETQLYCTKCERFLADRYVRGTCPKCGYGNARGDQCEDCGKLLDSADLKEPRCVVCGGSPEFRSTKHLYINLPACKERIEKWTDVASVKGRWAHNAVQMSAGWMRDGLRERAITRDLKWGIPVPKAGYEKKVFYVWFDAPIGYISITANWAAERGEDWKAAVAKWWKSPDETELFQFIGKDNLPFHTVIFPASLLGTGEKWTLLHHMSSSEYLNYENGKFSKSAGRGVFGTDAVESGITSDVWRFYIFYNRPEKADALFTWKDFAEKVNGELIGNLGNLVNRTLSFITRYYGGKAPAPGGNAEFWGAVRKAEAEIRELLEWAALREAYHRIFELCDVANKYFQSNEPWHKREASPKEAEAVIGDLASFLLDLAPLIEPYTPAAAEKLANLLGCTLVPQKPNSLNWDGLGKARKVDASVKSEMLFTKLDDAFIDNLRAKHSGGRGGEIDAATTVIKEEKMELPEITFLKNVDLRAAEIVAVERHPKADKLFIISLDIAGEARTIVSSLVGYYTEETLRGKRIIVAYNLKPAKLRGIESRGMLLAAEVEDADGKLLVEVLDVGGTPSGSRVTLEGVECADTPPAEIDIDTFFASPAHVTDNIVAVNGKPFLLNGKHVLTERVANGEVH